MARVAGRAPKPLPDSIIVGLRAMGFVAVDDGRENLREFALAARPSFIIGLAPSNLPGSSAVILTLDTGRGRRPFRMEADEALDAIRERALVAAKPMGGADRG